MRLKRNRLKPYSHRQAVPKKDKEGSSYTEYGPPSVFMAEVWPAGGKLQAELYGMRLPGIRNLRIQGDYAEITADGKRTGYQIKGGPLFCVNDGISLCVPPDAEPDYRIVAVYPYHFLTLEAERI